MTTVHHQRRHGSSKDLISAEEEIKFQSTRTSETTSVRVDELEGSRKRIKYPRSPTLSGKSRRSLSSSRRSGSARSLSLSEKSGSSRSLGSPKQRRRHQSNSRRSSKGEGNSSRRISESHNNSGAGDLLQSGSNSSSSSAEHYKSMPRTSKSRSRRSLMKDQRRSEEDELTDTTVSTTADCPFLEASDEDLSPKASRVMESPKSKRRPSRDSLSKSSHHSQSSMSPSRSITLNSSKRSVYNDTRSSKEILYGADGDIKAKTKSPRSTKPGVDRLRHSSHHKSNSNMDLLYGDDELKKSKRTSASRPGVERVQDTRELLYGDEEAKVKTNRISKSARSSSTPGVEEVDSDDDDGYSYDFPIASQRREVRSSLTAEDDSDEGENRTTAAADSVTIVQENKKSKRKMSTLCIICGILFALLVLVVGVVAGFMFLQRDEETIEPIAGAVNLTAAPNTFATQGPTQVPSTAAPSSPHFDPPSQEDCTGIGTNGTIPGQEDLEKLYFNIKLDVTLSVHGDISEEAVKELLAALERLFIPTLVGCSEADVGRRLRSRRLASRYVIGNADITGSVNPEAECVEGTPEPEKCHVIELELTVYLKGDAPEFDVFSIISEAGRGDLIPLLELPPATFAGVAMSSAGGVIPSDEPSTRPSPSPSASPSAAPSSSPSASPTKAPVVERTPLPTVLPSNSPSASASASPSSALSGSPTVQTSNVPSSVPTSAPSQAPMPPLTPSPSTIPSASPSGAPSSHPSSAPSLSSSLTPSGSSSQSPSALTTRCYCTTADACDNTTNHFSIGCGSCDGEGACTSMVQVNPEGGAVGANSCQGPGACKGASIYTIGPRSCTETLACHDRLIAVGSVSCTAQNSCSAMPVTTDLWNSARTGKLTVGTGSCTTTKACRSFFGTVGSGSCKGHNACSERLELNIGDNACLGAHACSYEAPSNTRYSSAPKRIRVVSNSCQGAYSCQCMTKVLVEGACNVLGECCDSSNPKRYAPDFASTSDLF